MKSQRKEIFRQQVERAVLSNWEINIDRFMWRECVWLANELWRRGLMAGTSLSHVIQSTVLELPRTTRHVRISAKSHRVSATSDQRPAGPCCIYVGPLETANKENLEALYCQVN